MGAVLKDTPSIVSPSGTAGMDFTDEAAAVNGADSGIAVEAGELPLFY